MSMNTATKKGSPESKGNGTKERGLTDLLKEIDSDLKDDGALATLVDTEGRITADLTMPDAFRLDIAADTMIQHLVSYEQSRQAWRVARAQGNGAKAEQFFAQWKFNQLSIALLQSEHPGIKAVADELMRAKAIEARRLRKSIIESEKEV